MFAPTDDYDFSVISPVELRNRKRAELDTYFCISCNGSERHFDSRLP